MTDLILHIKGIDDFSCSLEFYVERDRTLLIDKKELTRILLNGKTEYYAVLDADALGRGNLKCRIVVDETAGHETVISGFTGYGIPCYGDGRTIVCKDYAVSFEAVPKIPQSEAWVYMGKTNAVISDISEELGLRDFHPIHIETYEFESSVEREMVNVFAAVGSYDLQPDLDEVDEGRWWPIEEIDAAIGKDILTPNFESEFQMIRSQLLALL